MRKLLALLVFATLLALPASAGAVESPCPRREAAFTYSQEDGSYTTTAKRHIRFGYTEEDSTQTVSWHRRHKAVRIGKSWVTLLGNEGGTVIEPLDRTQRSYMHDTSDGFYVKEVLTCFRLI